MEFINSLNSVPELLWSKNDLMQDIFISIKLNEDLNKSDL